jgi:glutathione S-transferase
VALVLYAHPFSSYCQKVLIALYENDLSFTYLNLETPGVAEARAVLWPIGRFPVLVDGEKTVVESSIIIEHLGRSHPGLVRFLPDDPVAALEVRFLDRFFDNYVMAAMQRPVAEALRADGGRKDEALAEAGLALDVAYGWLEDKLGGRTWAAGEDFTLADCAAGPALFYADWVREIDARFPRVKAYRARLNARPSFARAIEEARPYRGYFPLEAPDRD